MNRADFRNRNRIEIVLGNVDALKRAELTIILTQTMEVRKALTCVLISVFLWAGDAQDSVPDSGESFQSCFNSELKYEILYSFIHRTRHTIYLSHMC